MSHFCTNTKRLLLITTTLLLLLTFFVISGNGIGLSIQGNKVESFHKTFIYDDDDLGADQSFINTRTKREVTNSSNSTNSNSKIVTNVNNLNDSHNQLIVYWAGKNVIVCLAKNITENSTSSLYTSRDYGSSFTNISESLVINENGKTIFPNLDKFYNHPKNNGHFLFTDVYNKYIFATEDYGNTFNSTKLDFSPEEISFDPKSDHNLVAHEKSKNSSDLWVSTDSARSWTRVQSHVKSISWDESSTTDLATELLISREEPGGSISILSSSSLFIVPSATKVIVSGVDEFEIRDDFMFASKTLDKKEKSLALLISYKRGKFIQAVFPNELPILHFHIGDVSEGQILVCAVHNESYANLYAGYQPTEHSEPIKFTLSLERIVFFKPSLTWTDSWLNDVTDETFVELHTVDGLRGVYIASQLKAITVKASKFNLEHVQSVITFDQGAKWELLDTPDTDNDGEPIYCKMAEAQIGKKCSLHISQRLSELHPTLRAKPVLSQKSAVGLVMATGTVDSSLKGHLGVYLSRDGAVHWNQVLKGNYLYNFGDHGGVIVAVLYYKLGTGTNQLEYSIDEGITWYTYQFYSEKIRVLGLMTEPGENTTVFFIFGSESKGSKHSWVLIKVDLKGLFDKACGKDDYKDWSPWDANPGRHCLLGRSDYYQRRLSNSACYNGLEYERPVRTKPCVCSGVDFECEFGYVQDSSTKELKCVKDSTSSSAGVKAEWCKPGESYYNKTRGYRKIPGDDCIGEENTSYVPVTMPCAVDEKLEFMLVAKRNSVLRIDLNDFNHVEVLPLGRLNSTVAIDFDLSNNCIFWSDVNDDKIMRLHLDGESEPEVLVSSGLKSVEGLAFDWISKTLYFADGIRKTIEVIRTDFHGLGRLRKKILGEEVLDKPRGLAVHPAKGLLFWTDWSNINPRVGSSNLDGSNFKVIVQNPASGAADTIIKWPNGLSIDLSKDQIYWVDAFNDKMFAADITGRNVRVMLENERRLSHPFGIAVYKNNVYWDDWMTNGIYTARIDSGNTLSNILTIKSNVSRCMDIKVYGHISQSGSNACSGDKNKCEFLCLAKSDNSHNCSCPDSLKLGTNGSCVCPDGKLVVDGHCVSNCNDTNVFKCRSGFCISNNWRCDGDNDCADNSDEEECNSVPKCAQTQFQCVADKKCIPIHWKCDFDVDCLDGSDEFDCETPRHCESPEHFECENKICLLKKWVCDGMDDCGDNSDERNCTHTLGSCAPAEFQCEDKRCISSQWVCDGDSDCSDGSDEKNCGNISCPAYKFRCTNTSQCILKSWLCDGDQDCTDNSDELNCTTTTLRPPVNPFPSENCSTMEQMFQCHNSENCIPIFWKCDSVQDCSDGSDELGCEDEGKSPPESVTFKPIIATCPDDHFQCKSGECIYEDKFCDGFPDCPGGDDEHFCDEESITRCPEGYVKCAMSIVCIPKEKVCDGIVDCPNKMDEQIMCINSNVTIGSACNQGEFLCDGNDCHPLYRLCDGRVNCFDATDEEASRCKEFKRIIQVAGIAIDEEEDISGEHVFIEWWVDGSIQGKLEFMPSWCITGTKQCSNSTEWIKDRKYLAKTLRPYTNYNVTVYARDISNPSIVHPPAIYKIFTTAESGSSPPRNVTVEQRDLKTICVNWSKPLYPNGNITKYFVHVTPPIPPLSTESRSLNHCFSNTNSLNSLYFRPQTNYSFWVTAKNGFNTSDESNIVSFIFREDIGQVYDIVVKGTTNTTANIEWSVKGKNVDNYQVTYEFSGTSFSFPQTVMTGKTNIQITQLSPGTKYKFSISPMHQNIVGSSGKSSFTTSGTPLSALKNLQVKRQNKGWLASWAAPSDNRTSNWAYGLYYGKSAADIANKKYFIETNSTSTYVPNLEGCEEYLFMVGIVGPMGLGPLSNSKQIRTPLDDDSPPKNLKVREGDDHMSMVLMWNSPCLVSEREFGYNITIVEIHTNHTKFLANAVTSSNHSLEYKFRNEYGGKYEAFVTTNSPKGRKSEIAKFDGIPLPPPVGLHECKACDEATVYWLPPPNLPKEINESSLTYIVHLSETEAFRDPVHFNTTELSFKFRSDIQNGKIYYVAVSFIDTDGLESPLSTHIALQHLGNPDKISMSTGNALGIVITVILVIGLLATALAIFVIRHRRLQASFLNFASTHYSTSSGAATFQQGLEDDHDTPIIRGFSDDEPLLVA